MISYDRFEGMRITRIAPHKFVAVCLSTGASGCGPTKAAAMSRAKVNRASIEATWDRAYDRRPYHDTKEA